jgi:hypothetical protein
MRPSRSAKWPGRDPDPQDRLHGDSERVSEANTQVSSIGLYFRTEPPASARKLRRRRVYLNCPCGAGQLDFRGPGRYTARSLRLIRAVAFHVRQAKYAALRGGTPPSYRPSQKSASGCVQGVLRHPPQIRSDGWGRCVNTPAAGPVQVEPVDRGTVGKLRGMGIVQMAVICAINKAKASRSFQHRLRRYYPTGFQTCL